MDKILFLILVGNDDSMNRVNLPTPPRRHPDTFRPCRQIVCQVMPAAEDDQSERAAVWFPHVVGRYTSESLRGGPELPLVIRALVLAFASDYELDNATAVNKCDLAHHILGSTSPI